LVDEHKLVEKGRRLLKLEEGSERCFEFGFGIELLPEFRSDKAGDFFIGPSIRREVLLLPMLWIFKMLWDTIPMMEEKVEVFGATEKRVAAFSVENGRVFLSDQSGEFKIGECYGISDWLVEGPDHVLESWDEVLRSNKDFVMILDAAKVDHATRMVQLVRVALPEVE
jgi:hypothetical protein